MARNDWAVARDGAPLAPANTPQPFKAKPAPKFGPPQTGGGFLPGAVGAAVHAAVNLLGQPTPQSAASLGQPMTGKQAKAHIAQTASAVAPHIVAKIEGKPVPGWGIGLDLAGILPFGRAAKAARDIVEGAAVAKEGEAAAKATGTALGTPGEVSKALRGAKSLQRQQAQLRSEEVGRRVQEAKQAMGQAGGGQAGIAAARGALRGELPKVGFGTFSHLDENAVNSLKQHITDREDLSVFDKINAPAAIDKIAQGGLPAPWESKLLDRIFGEGAAKDMSGAAARLPRGDHPIVNALNIPRSLMAAFDLSAPFRQGLVYVAGHPIMASRAFPPMIRALRSDAGFNAVQDAIRQGPRYDQMLRDKLPLTEMGEQIGKREEQFISSYAERIPIAGLGVRASGRAYVAFLNKARADYYNYLADAAEGSGVGLGEPSRALVAKKGDTVGASIARFVGSATGRGDLGALQSHFVTLNALFFSPRLLASRVNLLSPVYYARLDPVARQEAVKSMLKLATAAVAINGMAKMAGLNVVVDPRNPDWGKVKVGNTRIDFLGGFQQPIRLFAQIATKTAISSTTGKTSRLGPEGPGNLSDFDLVLNFARSKLAPVPGVAVDVAQQKQYGSQKFSWGQEAYQHLSPLAIQDAISVARGSGSIPAGLAAYLGSGLGVGVQNYGQRSSGYVSLPPLGSGSGGGPAPTPSTSGGRGGWSHTR